MNSIFAVFIPSLCAIIILPFIAQRYLASIFSAIFAVMTFLLSLPLIKLCYQNTLPLFFMQQWMICDKLSALFLGLNGFIAMTTSIYAINYFKREEKSHLHDLTFRFYHTFFHIFNVSLLAVVLSNNIGLMWIVMELATISSVVLVALYQTPEALEAAWKYLILCGVGIGFALIGTVIIYFAAHSRASGEAGLLLTQLIILAPKMPVTLLAIAQVFLFMGYGTKVGFFPLHNWLPDAHSEGPAPISAMLSGVLLNVAFFALLRFKMILSHTVLASFVSGLFLLFGFMSLLFAAFSLLRQRELKRLFAYSSIEHMGLISIAFGLGSSLAVIAGLLHMLMHSLSKSAAFFSSGCVIQSYHTQKLSRLRGLCENIPVTGWCLLMSSFALLGLPPFGLFFSELLLLLAMLKSNAWLVLPLLLGLIVAFVGILAKIQRISFANKMLTESRAKIKHGNTTMAYLHMSIVILFGIWIPIALVQPAMLCLTQGV